MEQFNHTIKDLFDQLGLESSADAIHSFINTHQLDRNTPIEKADFWKPHQAAFISEARSNDADWSEPVDDLDALLHKSSMK